MTASVFLRLKATCAMLLAAFTLSAAAQTYKGFEPQVSPDEHLGSKTLRLLTADGRSVGAPTLAKSLLRTAHQVGFSQWKISPDGTKAGWLVLTDAYAQSYPGAQFLVIMERGRIVRVIEGRSALFYWEFRDEGRTVAFVAGYYHFVFENAAVLQRVADGKILAEYWYPTNSDKPLEDVPDWAKSLPLR